MAEIMVALLSLVAFARGWQIFHMIVSGAVE